MVMLLNRAYDTSLQACTDLRPELNVCKCLFFLCVCFFLYVYPRQYVVLCTAKINL